MSKNSPLKTMLLLALREVLHQQAYGKSDRPYGYGQPKRPRGLKGWLTARALRLLDRNLSKVRR